MGVYLKIKNVQVTGSFKIRGIFNKILSLDPSDRGKEFVAASTGNHGVAFAHAITTLDPKGTVFAENASPDRVSDIWQYEVNVRFYGKDSIETEGFAKKFAEERGTLLVCLSHFTGNGLDI